MKQISLTELCFSFISIFLQLLNHATVIETSAAINCDKYKYYVQDPYQPYCMPCKICSMQIDSKHYNVDCKKKLPNYIPGQGHAWCTGQKDRSPWCPPLIVLNGELKCDASNSVHSKCTLKCKLGYTPEHSNVTQLVCLESLQWNITDQSLLKCQRAAKPDKPSISSPGQRQEVRSGSEKTLTCTLTSDVIGKQRIYWYFKDKQLPSDSDLNTYVIHGATKNNEGEYFCQVEDEIGRSEMSTGYFLKVEETHFDSLWQKPVTVLTIFLAVFGLVVLIFLYIKRRECYKFGVALWHKITVCRPHHEGKKIDSCLCSVATSVGSSTSGTSGICSAVVTIDGEVEQPLISEIECEQLTKKEIVNSHHEKPTDCPVTRDAKCPAEFMGFKDFTRVSSKDQNDLRELLKNWQLMKELRTSLDHISDINIDKPTFHSLGRHLGASEDEISHFEFTCRQKEISPTETYIRRMAEEGQGLSNLLSFLKSYKHTERLAKDVELRLSHL